MYVGKNLLALLFIFGVLLHWCCTTKESAKHADTIFNSIPSFIKDSVYLDPQNSFSKAKAALGRYLFYDRRLSVNNTKACASCHAQQFSFTDNYARSIGAFGDLHQRNARPLINLIFEKYLTAADSALHFPEQQINNPMFNVSPIEMGWAGSQEKIIRRIKDDSLYQLLFAAAFEDDNEPYTIKNIQYAITSFVKTITSFNSPYDKFYYQNDEAALTPSQKNGMALFFSAKLKCSTCHGSINFNTGSSEAKDNYFNTGLTNILQSSFDKGLYEKTNQQNDIGKYKVPTLRNLAFTAPYFHDGSIQSLDGVIELYEKGALDQKVTMPQKSQFITGFKLTSLQRRDLIAFLLSLSDSSVIINPRYANPFSEDETISVNK
jgi:cytochrome c peroxidase